jgi:hypothetical protein
VAAGAGSRGGGRRDAEPGAKRDWPGVRRGSGLAAGRAGVAAPFAGTAGGGVPFAADGAGASRPGGSDVPLFTLIRCA